MYAEFVVNTEGRVAIFFISTGLEFVAAEVTKEKLRLQTSDETWISLSAPDAFLDKARENSELLLVECEDSSILKEEMIPISGCEHGPNDEQSSEVSG